MASEAEGRHRVYVIASPAGRTYTGYTVDPARRLRQHNGEIAGGARSTRGRDDWAFLLIAACPTWDARRALQVEWKWKHPDRKRRVGAEFRGLEGRIAALPHIWARVPDDGLTIFVRPDILERVRALSPPAHVTIAELPHRILAAKNGGAS